MHAIGPQAWVRAASAAILAVVALAAVGQVWRARSMEQQRQFDSTIHALALSMNALGARLAMAANPVATGETSARSTTGIEEALRHSHADALQLDQLVALHMAAGRLDGDDVDAQGSAARLEQAQADWHVQREQLWYRAETLIHAIDQGDDRRARQTALRLQAMLGPATLAATELATEVTRRADQRRRHFVSSLLAYGVGFVVLLSGLVLVIGEVTARAVRRQHDRLLDQAQQLQRLSLVARHSANGMAVLDREGRIEWANGAFVRWFDRGASRAMSLLELLNHADLQGADRVALETALVGQRHVRVPVRCGGPGGRRGLELELQPLPDTEASSSFIVLLTDRTEQIERQETAALLAHTVDAAGVGTWQWDLLARRMVCNDRLLTMLGWRAADFSGSLDDWLALIHPDDMPGWTASIDSHLLDARRPCHAELRIRRPDGDWAVVQCCGVVTARDASDGTPLRMAGIHVDLTEQVQMQAMLRHAARTDGLTQLPNRAAVFDHVQQVIDRASRQPGFGYAVLFMDFDRFKQINDSLGHAAGDELLRQIAQRLRSALRAGDVVRQGASHGHTVGRIGGDEFVVVLEGIRTRDEAGTVARRLMEVLSQPYDLGAHTVHSTASIGIVTSEQAANDANTLMRDADTAMYEAKRAGRGRWVMFDKSMHERVAHGVLLENDLRHAQARQELFVVYQPVVPLQAGALLGVEALLRWRHPTRGLVPPSEFVPLAEESGLILSLGQWILEQACRQFVAWQQQLGALAPASLAVNLSPRQLQSPGLLAAVTQCLQDSGMPATALQLEVTESLTAQDENARARLRDLKALGLRIALDDFGTGYSSLACLHQLPVDTVKIDRSFVMHAEHSAHHRVLIEATIRVAQSLGMDTVAEGIETAEQAELMHAMHCDRGQGYLFSRPLGVADMPAWLRSRSPEPEAVAQAA